MTAATLERPAKERLDGTGPDGDDDEAAKDAITELEKITAERVDAVETPANGTPLLIMKAAGKAAKARKKGKRARKDDAAGAAGGQDGDGDAGDGAEKSTAAQPAASAPGPPEGAPPWEDYRKAVADWKTAEPSTKGALDGTDLLKARAEWDRWNTAGHGAGLDGTRAGYAVWAAAQVAKRDFDPNVGEHGTDRDKVPASDFVDPKGRRFPIHDASDVPDAVSSYGRADPKVPFTRFRSRLTSIARRKGYESSLPKAWETATAKEALEDCLAKSVAAGDLTQAQAVQWVRTEEARWAKGKKKKVLCGSCGARQNREHANCSECGKPLAGAVGVEKNHAYTCLKCGKSLDKGERHCPGCGKKNPGYLAEADSRIPANRATKAERAKATLDAAVAARLITPDAAGALLAEVGQRTAVKAGKKKGKRMLPATTTPAPAPAEASVTTKPPKSVAAMGGTRKAKGRKPKRGMGAGAAGMVKGVPYAVLRMHDATCAAFTPQAVADAYPALSTVAGAVDDAWFAKCAAEAVAARRLGRAAKALEAGNAARALLAADPAAVADGRARLAKAFESMYPHVRLSPSEPRKPGSFQRPYLSAGHAAEHAGQAPSAVPPSAHVPEPQQFDRGYLTGGHAARSPGDHAPNTPAPPDAGGRAYYAAGEAAMAEAAMRSVHDHIASTFAGACPMSPSVTQMPPDMGARNVPSSKPTRKLPKDMGGIATVKSAKTQATAAKAKGDLPPWLQDGGKPKDKKKGSGKKRPVGKRALQRAMTRTAAATAKRTAKALAGKLPDAATLTTIAAGTAQAAHTGTDSRLAELERLVKELGSQPDPALAPVRGQMARAPQGDAAPVEKRSLAAEALERRTAGRQAERARYLDYLEAQSQSPDPKVALRAEALLDKEMTSS